MSGGSESSRKLRAGECWARLRGKEMFAALWLGLRRRRGVGRLVW